MPNRSFHNLINGLLFKYSGNELHAYMDRAAKDLRQKHRIVGHDIQALMKMMLLFQPKYTTKQIMETWLLHKTIDGYFSGLQSGLRKTVQGYGKKDSILAILDKLKKEVFK